MPAAVAAGLPETTTPWLPAATLGPRGLTGVLVTCGHAKGASKKGASKRRETDDIETILRIIEVNSVVVASIHLPGMSSRLYQLSCSMLPRPPWAGTGEPKRETPPRHQPILEIYDSTASRPINDAGRLAV
jgi:hypothetical protein